MGMRSDIDVSWNTRRQVLRAEMIEENERADHAPPLMRQHAAHFEAAQVAAALIDNELEHRLPALEAVRARGVATALATGAEKARDPLKASELAWFHLEGPFWSPAGRILRARSAFEPTTLR